MPTDYPTNRDNITYTKLAQNLPEDYIDQGRIIDKLNGYLAWHHFPIQMDNEGVCAGLSMVYAKYVLEDRTEEFKRMLHLISTDIQPESESDNFINHFAVEVVLTQSPRQFEQSLSQNQSMQCLTIDGERLYSAFDFAITTKNENWAEIISDLDLKEDEPMLIRGKQHCICITKKNGRYTVYDPNYLDGFRCFENSTALVEQFQKCFSENPERFSENPEFYKPLCLEISVIRHPSIKNPRMPLFPTGTSLYEKYLTSDDANINDTLLHAACVGDGQAIHTLVRLGATAFQRATTNAILTKNIDALRILLPKIIESDPSYLVDCFKSVLCCGSEEIMDTFAMLCRPEYEAALDIENIYSSVYWAVASGNHIEKLLSDARKIFCQKNSLVDNSDNERKINNTIAVSLFEHFDFIKMAIEKNASDSIRTLISLADSSLFALSEEKKLNTYFSP